MVSVSVILAGFAYITVTFIIIMTFVIAALILFNIYVRDSVNLCKLPL